MEKTIKLKITILGPTDTGKTTIANLLAEVSEGVTDVRSTRGLRVVEFQMELPVAKGTTAPVDVQLWDCSGDPRYEPSWPLFFHDADGLILVCSKGSPEQKRNLESIYSKAIERSETLTDNCLIFSNVMDIEEGTDSKPIKSFSSKLDLVETNVAEKSDELRRVFYEFVSKVVFRRNKERKSSKQV